MPHAEFMEVESPRGSAVRLVFKRASSTEWVTNNKGWNHGLPWIAVGIGIAVVDTWYWLTGGSPQLVCGTDLFVGIVGMLAVALLVIGVSATTFFSSVAMSTEKKRLVVVRHALGMQRAIEYPLSEAVLCTCRVQAGPFVWSKPHCGILLNVRDCKLLLVSSRDELAVSGYLETLSSVAELPVIEAPVCVRMSGIPKSPFH